ncbi:MAG: YqeG family HAD IIIA-type phosphatase [Candidatus Eremiobacteraeota bacterium]|nr:YqeG family HAD IIIA-type phosphatase [Candidatus Eremiobacteraeota bacterium]
MLAPDRFAPRLCDVSLPDLAKRGFRGMIVDLDNTLVAYRQADIVEDHLKWIRDAHERGFRIVMLSNNFSDRVTRIAQQLNVQSVPNALKPLPFGFARALKVLGLPRKHVFVVGDQLFTDVLGAKLFGLYTILTEPIEPHDFAITRAFRFLERFALGGRRAQ